MRFFIMIGLVGLSSADASVRPRLEYSGKALGNAPLQAQDFKVSFDAAGLSILSEKELDWSGSQKSALKFKQVAQEGSAGTFRYQLEVPDQGGQLPKATRVSLKDNQIQVNIDKESLPLNFIPDGARNNTVNSMHRAELPSFRKAALVFGLILVVGIGAVIWIKRKGVRPQWMANMFGRERYREGPLVELVSKQSIGPKKQILVLRAGGEFLVVGCSGDQMSLLTKIDEQAVDEENIALDTEIARKHAESFV